MEPLPPRDPSSSGQSRALAGKEASPRLHIWLLGEFRLLYGEAPVNSVNTPRLRALLAYLLLHRQAAVPRKHLAFLFWPDSTEKQALTNLRNLLHKLRQALPDADRFFSADAQDVRWQAEAPCTIDVAEFDLAAGSLDLADLTRAADLYRGELMPSCYDDWIQPERERRQHLAIQAINRLANMLAASGDFQAAIGYGERLRQLDRFNEATWRLLMQLHAGNRDRAGVMHTYHICVQTLQAEFSADPSAETRELYERLLAGAVAQPAQVRAVQRQPPLVGRQREWERLQAAFAAARTGKSLCAILTGEAGIGKTRLAEALLDWARRQGAVVAPARSYAAEGALTFGPIIAWLRTPAFHQRLLDLPRVWANEAARVMPELLAERPDLARPGPLGELSQRQRLFEALARTTLSGDETLVLLIDDLPWCDRDTIEWLHFLLRFDPRAQLLVLGTARSEDIQDNPALGTFLTALSRDGRLSEIPLGRLSRDESASLVNYMTEEALSADQLTELYRETEGNPLFLVETVRSGLAGSAREPGSPRALPPQIHDILSARLAQLSPRARILAGQAAAIGRAFTLPVLARVSARDEADLVHDLDELWQRRIVRDSSATGADSYDFTHDKLREVAYNNLSNARRRLLHRSIAEAIEAVYRADLDNVSAQVAAHYEKAGLQDQAAVFYGRAADSARRVYANSDAIAYYRRALGLLSSAKAGEGRTTPLYERLADVLQLVGERVEARSAYRQALTSLPWDDHFGAARLQCKIGKTLVADHDLAAADEAFRLAYDALGSEPPLSNIEWWHEWLAVQHEQVLSYYWSRRVDKIGPLLVKARPFAEKYGTPRERANLYRSLMMLDASRRRWRLTEETLEYTRLYVAAQQQVDDADGLAWAAFSEGFGWLLYGDLDRAEVALDAALRQTRRIGHVALEARCLAYLTVIHRQRDLVDETRQMAAQSLGAAGAARLPEFVAMAMANQAWVAFRTGALAEAEAIARAALAAWNQEPVGEMSPPFHWLALWPLLALALADDDLAEAMNHAAALLDPSQQSLPESLTAYLEAAAKAWDTGQQGSARTSLQAAISQARLSHYL